MAIVNSKGCCGAGFLSGAILFAGGDGRLSRFRGNTVTGFTSGFGFTSGKVAKPPGQ